MPVVYVVHNCRVSIVLRRCANMNMFTQDVCALASVEGNNRAALMDAARQLAGAFTDLLNVAGSDEVCISANVLLCTSYHGS